MKRTRNDIESRNTPLYNTIKAYADSGSIPFHMPGHKMGMGLPFDFLEDMIRLDLTELPGLDNLHHPNGAIKEAQDLAAKAFGARKSYFLVNGSTCGIHAMISTICRPGDRLIISRDCHRSVIGGMMLAGASPAYILPEFSQDFGITTGVTPESVEAAMRAEPDAVGVLITRPNYYGVCSDLARISEIVHARGKLLIVDEAHGSHLCFSSELPASSMDSGADICVQSAHKTLTSLTQGAYLHVGSDAIDLDRLQYYLAMLQTSSPSYLIMASLDLAREFMQMSGKETLDRLISKIRLLKEQARPGNIEILGNEDIAGFELDMTRITICFRNIGLSGYEADALLKGTYGIQAEMSDLYNVVCIATPADIEKNLDYLFKSLNGLKPYCKTKNSVVIKQSASGYLKLPVRVLTLEEAMQAKSLWVRLERAAGKISKSIVAPYPPGIPVLCPGEEITQETVEYLKTVVDSGGMVNGINENCEINVV